jgi:hypothetical protein
MVGSGRVSCTSRCAPLVFRPPKKLLIRSVESGGLGEWWAVENGGNKKQETRMGRPKTRCETREAKREKQNARAKREKQNKIKAEITNEKTNILTF